MYNVRAEFVVTGEWRLYFPQDLVFAQNRCQSLSYWGMSPAVWRIESAGNSVINANMSRYRRMFGGQRTLQ